MMGSESGKIAIVAFGLEHCQRGVEAHARMLFEKLKKETEVVLIKGSGPRSKNEIVLRVPNRNTWLNRFLGLLRGYNIYWEQVFFMLRLTAHLMRHHSSYRIIYTQEYVHLIGMSNLKKRFGWQFELIYCEGFISHSDTRVRHADSLQEVNKSNYEYISPIAAKAGVPVKLIPHFFDPIWDEGVIDEAQLQDIVSFRGSDRLLIYVGPTDLAEKNFVRIEEALSRVGPSWKLLICGSASEETMDRLNKGAVPRAMTVYVSHAMMQRIYPMADLFVLPSLDEAFGIATIEAMGHGLPVLLHDSPHSRWLCNDPQQCVDMTSPYVISEFINGIADFDSYEKIKGQQNQIYFLNTFTWDHVKDDYLALFQI